MFAVTMDAVTMNSRSKISTTTVVSSPESAMASEIFNQFVSAGTFKAVLATYRQLCEVLRLKPTNFPNFYPKLKAKLHSWKAASLWAKIDKRASHKCYNRGKACTNTRVLIIGAGPCGLRTAIESQLLGAKVVVVEKRDRFSRNNVLHLWPFVIHDLRSLGAKKFFGKFCAGSIDHISIRQLQLILLKVALLLGVEVHENVAFKSLLQPTDDLSYGRVGWHAEVVPSDHVVSQYEFDVLIGADGKRNTLLGFNRKEFRGKLAIAITANFINRHTLEEARVPEISGVAFIFNQKFFQDMKEETGIDLENIVYYKDDTHYFVMTAKKQSLLDRGVILKDYNDTAKLLSPENVDREALMDYARDAANFSTNNQLPTDDFAINHYGQADVAMFDFTSMYAAENACRIVERKNYKLLQGLVGDSLLEPFWPTGSGCARGFLSALDAAWMIRSWASEKFTPLQVLAEREVIYRLLAQTTPENLNKNFNQITLNPATRYPNLVTHGILPAQLRSLYDTDKEIVDQLPDIIQDIPRKRKRRDYIIHPDALLSWCQKQVALCDNIKIVDMSSSWKNGLALCAIISRYRPDLIDLYALNPADVAKNNQLAFDVCERELGIPPVMTGQEMSECNVPDKLTMVSYISQIYEVFRGEIPYIVRPMKPSAGEDVQSENYPSSLSIFSKLNQKLQGRKSYSLEKKSKDKEKMDSLKRSKTTNTLNNRRRSREKDKGIALEKESQDIALKSYKKLTGAPDKASFNSRIRDLEEKMRKDAGLRSHAGSGDSSSEVSGTRANKVGKRPHSQNIKLLEQQLKQESARLVKSEAQVPKVGKICADDWNVKHLEQQKIQQSKNIPKTSDANIKTVSQDIFTTKIKEMSEKLSGVTVPVEVASKYQKIDANIQHVNHKLKTGYLDTGNKRVAAMTEYISTISDHSNGIQKKPPLPEPTSTDSANTTGTVGGSEICYFCQKRVYLMERLSAEGLFFHRSCLKCEYCGSSLRLGNYAFDRTALCGGKFYCKPHFRMQKPDTRWQEMMKRKHAFLAGGPDAKEIFSTIAANALAKSMTPEKSVESENIGEVEGTPENQAETITEDQAIPSLLPPPVVSVSLRDQTPERVEYENSLIELSEEELLTSELEEEELTQKNLGAGHDLETSDDEFSDLSTDTESEEEAFAEELERSMTADETRRLAETWQMRYSQEHRFLDKDKELSSSEGSETEIGSDTSEDIDSDEEYSDEESLEDEAGRDSKTPIESKELVVQVPVIDLKKGKEQVDEDLGTEEDSSEITDTDESTVYSSEESDSESDQEAVPPVPQQIPTIIIEESPPQEKELIWGENTSEANAASDNNSNIWDQTDNSNKLASHSNQENICTSEDDLSLVVNIDDIDQMMSSSSNEGSLIKESVKKTVDDISPVDVCDESVEKDDSAQIIPFPKTDTCEESKDVENKNEPILFDPDQTENNVREIAAEIIKNIVSEAKEILATTNTIRPVPEDLSVPEEKTVEIKKHLSSCEDLSLISPESIPVFSFIKEIDDGKESKNYQHLQGDSSDENIKIHEYNSDQKPLISPLSDTPHEKDDYFNILATKFTAADSTSTESSSSNESLLSSPLSPDAQIPSSNFVKLVSSDESEIISTENHHLSNTDDNLKDITSPEPNFNSDIENIDFNFNPSFVTIRNKRKMNNNNTNDIFCYDSDIIPLTMCIDDLKDSPVNRSEEVSPVQGVYRANVIQCVDSEDNICEDYFETQAPSSLPTTKNEFNKMEEKIQNTEEQMNNISELSSKESNIQLDKDSASDSAILTGICKNASSESIPEKDIKFHGYSGSFAEKIRPKSFVGDSIYLKSLNINLQKLKFPSVTRSLEKLNVSPKCNLSDSCIEHNLQLSKSTESSHEKYFSLESKSSDNLCVDNSIMPSIVRFASSTPIKQHKSISPFVKSVLPASLEERNQLVCNNSEHNIIEIVHSRVKDQNKLAAQKKYRKSIHEDIEGVPFADEEKHLNAKENSVDANVSFESMEFFTPIGTSKCIREQCTAELEKARKEARERARLKSDEELGLSPNLYRKRYRRQSSLTSIQYEELLRDDLLYDDEDDGDEDEYSEEIQHDKNESFQINKNETAPASSPPHLKTDNVYSKVSPLSPSEEGSCQSHNGSVLGDNLSPTVDTMSSDKNTQTTTSSTSKTDAANYLESSVSIDDIDVKLSPGCSAKGPVSTTTEISVPLSASSETSPEAIDIDESNKSKQKIKQKLKVAISPDGDEKKNATKKSLFSLLNFTKNGNNKEKTKSKCKDDNSKENSPPLISDLSLKTPPKLKSFPHLKLPRSKDRNREKQRKKYQITEKTDSETSVNFYACEQQSKINKFENFRKSLEKLTTKASPSVNQVVNVLKVENGVAPKASEDSFSDTEEDTQASKNHSSYSTMERKEKSAVEKEKKALRVAQKVQRQQELKRLRTAQEIHRHLQELEVQQRELEQQGVEVEKALRGESEGSLRRSGGETELMQEWFNLVRAKNKLVQKEQELLIKARDVELEERHSRLQQELRQRLTESSVQKSKVDIEEEGRILAEMLEIVEKRDELVTMIDQLQIREEEEEKDLESKLLANTLQFSPTDKS